MDWYLVGKIVLAVLGAVTASVGQFYPAESMPEWAKLFLVLGGAVAAAIGGVMAGKDITMKFKAVDKDGDGDVDYYVPTDVEAKDGDKKPPVGPLMGLFLAVVLMVGMSGCSMFEMHPYDPMTAAQIQKTITFEELDYSLSDAALKELSAPEAALEALKVRHDSEIARLKAWLLAEEAKKVDEEKAEEPQPVRK